MYRTCEAVFRESGAWSLGCGYRVLMAAVLLQFLATFLNGKCVRILAQTGQISRETHRERETARKGAPTKNVAAAALHLDRLAPKFPISHSSSCLAWPESGPYSRTSLRRRQQGREISLLSSSMKLPTWSTHTCIDIKDAVHLAIRLSM